MTDPGWLQLQRERFDLDPGYAPPPAARIRPLGGVLPEVLKEMGLESRAKIADLTPKWPELVGAANARHCRPGEWKDGVLTVYVDHNVWLAELKRFGSKAIAKRVRAQYGADSLTDIRFQIDPGDDPA